jgi:hypothetical protein
MALTLVSDTDKIVGLEEYVDYVAREVDVSNEDSIIASAPMLQALGNNRHFVSELLTAELRSWQTFQEGNDYTAPTLMLAQRELFAVRANIWEPPARTPEFREHQKSLYYYDMPHDHNFSFLTVGYFGPGYETVIYEREHDAITGIPGQKVELRFLERTTLPQGKVMFYRASRDIHRQEHPEAFSLSINLLVTNPGPQRQDQYFFDLENGAVLDVGGAGTTGSRVLACRLARYIGDGRTADALEPIATTHPTPRVRATALESLATLAGASAKEVWRSGEADPHPLVRHCARRALAGLE